MSPFCALYDKVNACNANYTYNTRYTSEMRIDAGMKKFRCTLVLRRIIRIIYFVRMTKKKTAKSWLYLASRLKTHVRTYDGEGGGRREGPCRLLVDTFGRPLRRILVGGDMRGGRSFTPRSAPPTLPAHL